MNLLVLFKNGSHLDAHPQPDTLTHAIELWAFGLANERPSAMCVRANFVSEGFVIGSGDFLDIPSRVL